MICGALILAGSLMAFQKPPEQPAGRGRSGDLERRLRGPRPGHIRELRPAWSRRAAREAGMGRDPPQGLGQQVGPHHRERLAARGPRPARAAHELAPGAGDDRQGGRSHPRLDRSGAQAPRGSRPARPRSPDARPSLPGRRAVPGATTSDQHPAAPARLALRVERRRDHAAGRPQGRPRGPGIRDRRGPGAFAGRTASPHCRIGSCLAGSQGGHRARHRSRPAFPPLPEHGPPRRSGRPGPGLERDRPLHGHRRRSPGCSTPSRARRTRWSRSSGRSGTAAGSVCS